MPSAAKYLWLILKSIVVVAVAVILIIIVIKTSKCKPVQYNGVPNTPIGLKMDKGIGKGYGQISCNCGNNDYLKNIYVSKDARDQYVNGLKFECAKGYWKKFGTLNSDAVKIDGPFNSINGSGDSWINSLFGIGKRGGTTVTSQCPNDQKVTGAFVTYGDFIGQVIPYCGN